MDIDANDPSLAEAANALAQMEAEESAANNAPQAPAKPAPDSVTTEQHAAQAENVEVQPTISQPETNNGASATEKQQTKTPETPQKQSNYAKNQERLQGGWKTLNENKDALAKEREAFKIERENHARKVKALEEREAKLNKPTHTPEEYDQFAEQCRQGMEAAEAKGDYDRSEELKVLQKQARAQAAHLRANPWKPPPSDAEAQAALETSRKEWMSKAAIDFPESAKAESEEGVLFRKLLVEIPGILNEKQEVVEPRALYQVARLAHAEVLAARASNLEKEVVGLRAKVKELDGKLATPAESAAAGTPRGAKPFGQLTEAEQEAELIAMAEQDGSLKFSR